MTKAGAKALVLFILIGSFYSVAEARSDKIVIGSQFYSKIKDLHPTQVFLGFLERADKILKLKFLRKNDPSKYKTYLESRPVDVVIGRKGILYIVDRHHLASALFEIGTTEVLVNVVGIFDPEIPEDEFHEQMYANGWVFLHDENGKAIIFDQLPQDVTGLKDSLYRSLVWRVRELLGFKEEKNPHAENQWTLFYINQLKPGLKKDDDVDKALSQAVQLTKSREATSLGLQAFCGLRLRRQMSHQY